LFDYFLFGGRKWLEDIVFGGDGRIWFVNADSETVKGLSVEMFNDRFDAVMAGRTPVKLNPILPYR